MSIPCPVRRYKDGKWESFADSVSRESRLSLYWHSCSHALSGSGELWAWPGPDEAGLQELALGHVLTDLLPFAANDPMSGQDLCGTVTGTLNTGYRVELSPLASPCSCPVLSSLPPDLVLSGMDAFISGAGKWDGTGCFHRAGYSIPSAPDSPSAFYIVEDIGRHNCLDRLAGHAAISAVSLSGGTLFVTARITASLYAKARRIGFTQIISRSAVTLNAITRAQEEGVRLIGFCRPAEGRFTVFAE